MGGILEIPESIQSLTQESEVTQLATITELVRQKSKLERLAKLNQLSQADLMFLKQVETILRQYLDLIERWRELNRRDFRL